MTKKTKIILGVGIGLMLFILDQHFLRIVKLEEKTESIPLIESRLSNLEKNGIFVFRTEQSSKAVDDVCMGSASSDIHTNWGARKNFGVGVDTDHDTYRSLIRFNEINAETLKGVEILEATMYLKRFYNDAKGSEAAKEIFDVFMVRREWQEGDNVEGSAGKGELSWLMISEGITSWAEPGCGDKERDYDPTVLASSDPHFGKDPDAWVPFRFNEEGIKRLQGWVNGSPDFPYYGFLIKARGEDQDKTYIVFRSSEYEKPTERPYLQIFYIKN